MSENSKIEWTDATWNPVLGCDKISPGCKNCYAIRTAWRLQHNPNPKVAKAFEGLTLIQGGQPNWTGRVNFVPDRLREPLTWKKPRRVFVNSQSDLFHGNVTDEQIVDTFAMMALAHWHTFQVLTKRPERALKVLNGPDIVRRICAAADKLHQQSHLSGAPEFSAVAIRKFNARMKGWWEYVGQLSAWTYEGGVANEVFKKEGRLYPSWIKWPLPNVWLGVSCENQQTADERIPLLLQTPAAVRWISAEPLLGPINFLQVIHPTAGTANVLTGIYKGDDRNNYCTDRIINWVVAGGESGPGARPMHPDWARSLRDQCKAAGVPFFFKQWGGWHWQVGQDAAKKAHQAFRLTVKGRNGSDLANSGDGGDVWMYPVGKKAAGRKLDGIEHNDYPSQ